MRGALAIGLPPPIGNFARAWTWWLAPAFGQGLSIAPDVDALPVFADERAAAWARIEGASFLTVNEKRGALGFEPIAGGDVLAAGGGSAGGRGRGTPPVGEP